MWPIKESLVETNVDISFNYQCGNHAMFCSDSIIRVFTAEESRQAPADEVKAFEEQVSSSQIPTQVGDIDAEKLPGQEILLAPGRFAVTAFHTYFRFMFIVFIMLYLKY